MCARIVTGLLFFGSWTLPSSFVASFVEPNKVLIGIIILIVIDAKGAQALRAARVRHGWRGAILCARGAAAARDCRPPLSRPGRRGMVAERFLILNRNSRLQSPRHRCRSHRALSGAAAVAGGADPGTVRPRRGRLQIMAARARHGWRGAGPARRRATRRSRVGTPLRRAARARHATQAKFAVAP